MPILNSLQRTFRVPTNNRSQVVSNSIANDFLRRGALKAQRLIEMDQKFDPETTIKGYLYAALERRKEVFAEYAEENVVSEDKNSKSLMHPYLRLIENSKVEDEYEFWRDLIADYDMYGEAYIFVLRRVVYDKTQAKPGEKLEPTHIGTPTAIKQLDASKMTILRNGQNEIVGYREQVDSTHVRNYLPEQIIRIYNKHPLDPERPLSVFDACKDYQYTINKGSEYSQAALANSTNTPGIISTESVLTQEEYDNLISRINGHESGKFIITDGASKLQYTSVSNRLEETALPSLTDVNRQTIFAVTGTSKTVLGIEESGTTRDTAKVQERQFIRRTIRPLVKRFLSAFNFDYRTKYPEEYKISGVKMVIANATDAAEDKEKLETQRMFFDDAMEIVYSGFEKESAQKFLNGEIDFTELKVDGGDAEEIEEETETLPDDGSQDGSKDDSNDPQDDPGDGGGVTTQQLDDIHIENIATHNHDETITDDYVDKALQHLIVDGEYTEYGKVVKAQTLKAKEELLKEVRSAQLDAIKNASSRLAVNNFNYADVRSEDEENSLLKRLFNAFRKYWLAIVPVIGRERLSEDREKLGLDANINLLGTAAIQSFITSTAERESKSHADTIYKDILGAANRGYEKAANDLFAEEYIKEYKQGENKWFKSKPTKKEVKSKLKNEAFKQENVKLYQYVQKKISEGYNRQEIQSIVRNEYVNLSRRRANMLVGNEMAKAINASQYMADLELLKETNMLDRAYKRLTSSTGDPCAICNEIIKKGDVPFTENFVDLGDSITAVWADGKKSQTMVFNYEAIRDGVVHPNCHCYYELIVK